MNLTRRTVLFIRFAMPDAFKVVIAGHNGGCDAGNELVEVFSRFSWVANLRSSVAQKRHGEGSNKIFSTSIDVLSRATEARHRLNFRLL
jgi:hypothetical protein